MPEVWIPWAVRLDGAHANYEAGRIGNVTTGLAHYTVGRNSTGTCGRDFQLLGARDGTLYQGAPIDAVCWGAGDPWNGCSVHYEIEYLPGADDAVFTDLCRDTTQRTVHWVHDNWGIPLDYYHGPRIPAHNGWIAHDSVIQTGDYHNDFWPAEDAAIIFGTAPPPLSPEDTMWLIHDRDTNLHWIATANGMVQTPESHSNELAFSGIKRYDLPTATVQWLGANLHAPAAGSGTGGPLKVVLSGTATPS